MFSNHKHKRKKYNVGILTSNNILTSNKLERVGSRILEGKNNDIFESNHIIKSKARRSTSDILRNL